MKLDKLTLTHLLWRGVGGRLAEVLLQTPRCLSRRALKISPEQLTAVLLPAGMRCEKPQKLVTAETCSLHLLVPGEAPPAQKRLAASARHGNEKHWRGGCCVSGI